MPVLTRPLIRHSDRFARTRATFPQGGRLELCHFLMSFRPRRKTTFQTNTCQRRLAVGRTRNAPTTLYQSLYLPLLNVISTEAIAKWRNPLRLSPDNDTTYYIFDLCGRTRASAPTCSVMRYGCLPNTSLPQLFSTFKALRGPGHSRKAVSHRGRVFGIYRSEATVFAPARSLDFARDDGAKYRSAWFCGRTRASAPTYSTKGKYQQVYGLDVYAWFYNDIL